MLQKSIQCSVNWTSCAHLVSQSSTSHCRTSEVCAAAVSHISCANKTSSNRYMTAYCGAGQPHVLTLLSLLASDRFSWPSFQVRSFPWTTRLNLFCGCCSTLCDPYLNLFRGLIPPIGGQFDVSPILAFLLLNVSFLLCSQ